MQPARPFFLFFVFGMERWKLRKRSTGKKTGFRSADYLTHPHQPPPPALPQTFSFFVSCICTCTVRNDMQLQDTCRLSKRDCGAGEGREGIMGREQSFFYFFLLLFTLYCTPVGRHVPCTSNWGSWELDV